MMGLIDKVFSDMLITSLGWTLIHSLWQGMVITLIAVLLLLLLKRENARIRYLIGVGMLVLMILVSLVTFFMVYRSGIDRVPVIGSPAENGTDGFQNSTGGFLGSIKMYFDRNLPAVVTVWLMGMIFFFLRFVSGIMVNQRLRHHLTRDVSATWSDRVNSLSRQMKIRSVVIFRESFMTNVPLTIGYLKPVILFPVGILTQVPPDQVEALIVHELAHILRKDYLVNVLQNVADIIYFYHPGIRWISQQVRNERENCCDDITVELMGDSLNYARALTRAGEFSLKTRGDLAMAASGDSSKLFKRIRRLFPMKKDRSRSLDGFFGFLLTVVFAGALVLWLNASCWLFAGPGKAPDRAEATRADTVKKDDVRRLMERHEQLAAKDPASLTKAEQHEFQEISIKLNAIKRMEEEKKLKLLTLEFERLKAKSQRTEAENKKLQKMSQFLKQYELKLNQEELSRKLSEMRAREKSLSEAELKEMKALEMKLKQEQFEEQRMREMERRERAELEREREMQESRERALREEKRAQTEQEKQLVEREKRLKEEESRKYREQMEIEKIKLKEEYEYLGFKIERLAKKSELTEAEKDRLKKLKEKREQIRITLEKMTDN